MNERRFTSRCFARAGLLGNPSDGFGGATISLTIPNWQASAVLQQADDLHIAMGNDERRWDSAAAMMDEVARGGHREPGILLTATIARFLEFHDIDANRAPGFHLAVDSTIPLQVGLAGSSAIIIATLRCLNDFFGRQLPPEILASLALSVETEILGIPAGLQDRVSQSLEGLVAMDFAPSSMRVDQGLAIGRYERLPIELLPHELYVAWSRRGAESTAVPHSNLRTRFDRGDADVVSAMQKFASIAREGVEVLRRRDHARLNELINENFDLRRSICHLNPVHIEMIETARRHGASAKYCGSGGAIIGLVPAHQLSTLTEAMQGIDSEVITPLLDVPM